MDQQPSSTSNPEPTEGYSVVIVPDHLHQQVMDYVADVTQDEPDVSGYLISSSLGSISRSTVFAYSSGTSCKFAESTKGLDWSCSDND